MVAQTSTSFPYHVSIAYIAGIVREKLTEQSPPCLSMPLRAVLGARSCLGSVKTRRPEWDAGLLVHLGQDRPKHRSTRHGDDLCDIVQSGLDMFLGALRLRVEHALDKEDDESELPSCADVWADVMNRKLRSSLGSGSRESGLNRSTSNAKSHKQTRPFLMT